MVCSKTLSGKWNLLGTPRDWTLVAFVFNSKGGDVVGTADFLINGNPVSFDVRGHYNGAALDLSFRGAFVFHFSGNCEHVGDNIFKGGLEGERDITNAATISPLGS